MSANFNVPGVPNPLQYNDNGLTQQQNEDAVRCISKLKVHELSSIISSIAIRRPRANKGEQQKALYGALFEKQHSTTVWKMALGFQQPNNGYDNHGSKRVMPAANRNHPYMNNGGLRNGAANNANLMQHHYANPMMNAQMFQQQQQQYQHQHHQQQQQQHAQSVQRTLAPPFEIVPLPFYDVISTILAPVELHATFNGQKQSKTLQFNFQLTQEQVSKIYRHENSPLPRYEVQLRFFNITDLGQVAGAFKDDFPLNAGVRVNDQQVSLPHVIPTNKPNVEPKRPSRPVNITPHLWRLHSMNHKIMFEWLGDRRVYAAAITFVHRVNADILFKRINDNPDKHKLPEVTKKEVRDKLTGSGEEDIAMDQLKISLLDPLIKSRMVTPSRCRDCTHLQCFDLSSYLKMNEKKPTWQCPVCSNYCPYDRLIVDDYFLDMLAKVDKSTTEVELKQDGSYDVIGVDDEVCLSDDDDDIKPVVLGGPSSSGSTAHSSSEPPQNGGKKKMKMSGPPADEDIIVLSDDDDEDLTRGIQMSLNDYAANSGGPSGSPKTPPRPVKKSKSGGDIEIITLDDTPPRPAAANRQMSLQQQPTSSNASSNPPNISDALAKIGGMGNAGGSANGRVSFNFDQQQQPQQHQSPQPSNITSYQAVQAAHAAHAVSQQQYGYSNMQQAAMQQQYHMHQQQQLIGRANQMGQMGHPGQQQGQGPQGMMMYGQQAPLQPLIGPPMHHQPPPPGVRLVQQPPRPLLEIPLPPGGPSPPRPLVDMPVPSRVTQRKHQMNGAPRTDTDYRQ